MTTPKKANGFAQRVAGHTIERVDLRAYVDESPAGCELETIYNPVFYLSNGGLIRFIVQETDNGGGYGILPIYEPPKK